MTCSFVDFSFLTNGASEGVKTILQTIVRDHANDAVLAPIPQYPLYSGSLALLNGTLLPYYLDESAGWACLPENLDKALQDGIAAGHNVRALVVINPGNPTGQV
jgi:aspartate/methionine/tyrosine aminotransferase